MPELSFSLSELDKYIANKDANVPHLKPDNESRIIWTDSTKKTPYSLVYLHGFSASPMEGDPTHRDFATKYGMNCYIPRLAGHGLADKNSFENLSPKDLIDSAKEALAIGHLIGEKVIVMSCSTGSTLSIYLAANHPEKIHAMIMYSPNLQLSDEKATLLAKPWGLQMARYMVGDTRKLTMILDTPKEQYTTVEYKVEGIIALQNLLQETMTPENFKKVSIPFLCAYYFKDENHCDYVISVPAIRKFGETVSTPSDKKRLVALPEVDTHVIPSGLYCQDIQSVRDATYGFADEVLGLSVR